MTWQEANRLFSEFSREFPVALDATSSAVLLGDDGGKHMFFLVIARSTEGHVPEYVRDWFLERGAEEVKFPPWKYVQSNTMVAIR